MKTKVLIVFNISWLTDMHSASSSGVCGGARSLTCLQGDSSEMQENTENTAFIDEKVRLSGTETQVRWRKVSKPRGRKSHTLEPSRRVPPQTERGLGRLREPDPRKERREGANARVPSAGSHEQQERSRHGARI